MKLLIQIEQMEKLQYVSSDGLANWMSIHSPQQKGHPFSSSLPGSVEWTLFVPARDHSPLAVRDDSSGEEGGSIIISPPSLDGERSNGHSNGMSIVNLPSFRRNLDSDAINIDLDKVYQSYVDRISASLGYLVGNIRAMHGLPPRSSLSPKYVKEGQMISFWELESIARSHFPSSLDLVFRETETLLAVLHEHSWTLAFPEEVAHKLNNGTHLLRQSIALIEQGYPTMYALSLLRGSLQHIESVKNDHRFHELPYFAPDHYLAVFSPLVLPLLLPMIMGLVREFRRFRELQKKKNLIP